MILTCDNEDSNGTMVIVDGGNVQQQGSAARSKGTTFEVKNLFFNVPVRKKFQRSPNFDTNEILKVMNAQALAHPEIKFELLADQKTLLSTLSCLESSFEEQLRQRIKEVLGGEFYRGTCYIENKKDDMLIRGLIGLPTFTRHNRTGQHLFINRRAVMSPLVGYAVRDGYSTSIGTHRYPVYALHLDIPGGFVDVNVHPQKREVRLRQEQELRQLIFEGVDKALQKQGHRPEPLAASNDYVVFKKPEAPPVSYQSFEVNIPKREISEQPKAPELPVVEPPRLLATIPGYLLVDPNSLNIIDQANGVCLVDQRAAHSRIIFEQYEKEAESPATQPLLIPHTIKLSTLDSELLEEHLEILNGLGIKIHASGPETYLVDAIPQCFGQSDIELLINDLIHQIRQFGDTTQLEKERGKMLASAASRAAISNKSRLPMGEAQSLLNRLLDCEKPLLCPRGKPTLAALSTDELQEKFKGK